MIIYILDKLGINTRDQKPMRNWIPDGASTRARIGVLTPHLDAVPESEFQVLAPDGVSIHAAPVPLEMVGPDGDIIPNVDVDIAKAFAEPPGVDNAASLLAAASPGAIVFAFTSSSYILGPDEDVKLKNRLEQRTNNIPVIVQSDALIVALRALNASRIVLVHPPWYSDELDDLGTRYFENGGFEVLGHAQAKLRDNYGDMTMEKIFDWVTTHTPEGTDAVVIGGGGFRAIGVINEIENSLNIPILSANQASFWLALRMSGIEDRLNGYGRIFEKSISH